MSKLAIVAVESNLIGRTATAIPGVGMEHLWKFKDDVEAEVVAVFVGDMDEGGVLKVALRGTQTGAIKTFYLEHVVVAK